jgi:hypothetical protein
MSKMLGLAMCMAMACTPTVIEGSPKRRSEFWDSDLEDTVPDALMSFKDDDTTHEFIIHGVKITARNRKMAEKIYRNQRSTSKTVNNG